MSDMDLATKIAQLALSKKGYDIRILDLRGLTDVADYFVLVSGESDMHVKTLADFIERELKDERIRPWHKEGYIQRNWVLLDYVDTVVHIFREETRQYYGLERLWADAKVTEVEDDAPIGKLSE